METILFYYNVSKPLCTPSGYVVTLGHIVYRKVEEVQREIEHFLDTHGYEDCLLITKDMDGSIMCIKVFIPFSTIKP